MPLRRHVRGRLTKEQRLRRVVEDALVGAGLSEAYTWSLVGSDPNPDAIRLPSPMTSDQAILRTTIVPGLLEAARTGIDAGAEHVALFEIARVYLPSGEQLPDERWRVAGVVAGRLRRREGRSRDALRRARASSSGSSAEAHELLHPGKAAMTEAGWLGELHPTLLEGTWGAFELDLDDALRRRAGSHRLRGRPHVSRNAAGHRRRRRRGRRGRRARRRRARGGR